MNRPGSGWLAERRSLAAAGALVLGFYAPYETSRGLEAAGPQLPCNARLIASLERWLHVFVERTSSTPPARFRERSAPSGSSTYAPPSRGRVRTSSNTSAVATRRPEPGAAL